MADEPSCCHSSALVVLSLCHRLSCPLISSSAFRHAGSAETRARKRNFTPGGRRERPSTRPVLGVRRHRRLVVRCLFPSSTVAGCAATCCRLLWGAMLTYGYFVCDVVCCTHSCCKTLVSRGVGNCWILGVRVFCRVAYSTFDVQA